MPIRRAVGAAMRRYCYAIRGERRSMERLSKIPCARLCAVGAYGSRARVTTRAYIGRGYAQRAYAAGGARLSTCGRYAVRATGYVVVSLWYKVARAFVAS